MGGTAKKSNVIDKYVGSRMRARREKLGLTQRALAEALGITYQQIQKLEDGTNRIGAGRLQQISRILDAPVAYFFERPPHVGRAPALRKPKKAVIPTYITEFVASADGLALSKAFMRISDRQLRRILVALVERLAGASINASTRTT